MMMFLFSSIAHAQPTPISVVCQSWEKSQLFMSITALKYSLVLRLTGAVEMTFQINLKKKNITAVMWFCSMACNS